LPASAADAAALLAHLTDRLKALAEQASQLARSRTGDERRAADLASLLLRWLVHGKPARTAKEEASPEPPDETES
jgi:hypothetical protein